MSLPATYLQLFSTLTKEGELRLELKELEIPTPDATQVVIRVEATPINPSDLGVMFGWADMSQAQTTGSGNDTVLTAPVSPAGVKVMAARVGQSLPIGNEGAGTVVATGSDDYAKSLEGKVVAAMGGGMYGQYRCVDAAACLPLQDGHSAKDGASCFVNPLTALCMIETMKSEGHTALVHTAAASNLGQMLNRVCQKDGIELINIVRKPEQVELLNSQGAKYICNSSDDSFMSDLARAIEETGAYLAFDATGGGELGSRILTCMEKAALKDVELPGPYGSNTFKQLYIYGSLDLSPTIIHRNFGFSWGINAWLLTPFIAKVGPERAGELRQRVADELHSTFASHYSDEVSLLDVLQADVVAEYSQQATGKKYLINPSL